jgi:archaetidylinositol phosphate synthase
MTVARVHDSVSAPYERRLLIWLAARLPGFITPDHLTFFGVAGSLLCGVSYAATLLSRDFLWLASFGLVANWFGDSLDGTLARYRKTERPRYGFFIDHTTDVVSQAFIFLGLGASPFMHFETACLALMSYWLAALYTFIRALATNIFQISYWGIGPTEIRLSLLAYNLILLVVGPAAIRIGYGSLSLIDVLCSVIFVMVFLSFLVLILHEGRRLAVLEAPPPDTLTLEAASVP